MQRVRHQPDRQLVSDMEDGKSSPAAPEANRDRESNMRLASPRSFCSLILPSREYKSFDKPAGVANVACSLPSCPLRPSLRVESCSVVPGAIPITSGSAQTIS